jgi:hypothetical protein
MRATEIETLIPVATPIGTHFDGSCSGSVVGGVMREVEAAPKVGVAPRVVVEVGAERITPCDRSRRIWLSVLCHLTSTPFALTAPTDVFITDVVVTSPERNLTLKVAPALNSE